MQHPDEGSKAAEICRELTQPSTSNQFSKAAKITCVLLIVLTTMSTAYASPLAALILPVLAAPTLWLFWYHSSLPPSRGGSSERIFWIYVATALGILIVMALQGLLLLPFVILVFGPEKDFLWHEFETVKQESDIIDNAHRAARAAFAARPSYWAFIAYFSFVAAAGIEELLKFAMVLLGKGRKKMHDRESIMYGVIAGLSFATYENISFLAQACQTESGWKLGLTVLERLVLGLAAHMIGGALSASGVVLRDRGLQQMGLAGILGPSIFFHGLFDFVLFGYCAWRGHIGWVHPEDPVGSIFLLVAVFAVTGTAALVLRNRLAKLKVE